MKDSIDVIAKLLSAADHPHLRDEPDFVEAEKMLAASPELQRQYAESKTFFEAHPVLTQIEGMPEDCRQRIQQVLLKEQERQPEGKIVKLTPWGVRKNFAWAAVLALLLAGMSVLSTNIIDQKNRKQAHLAALENKSPAEAFYQYAGELADGRLPLQYRENGSAQLVSWLEDQGARPFTAPSELLTKDTMGCAYLDGPNGKVSLICFHSDQGTMHLFVTAAESVELEGVDAPKKAMVNDRQAVKWHDEKNAYLLIAHDKEQALPEVFL
ncbi:hypothetical protein P0Y35_09890 [Kiritimatiellaeota bacterium B1221]|nr:hypothetical protein [Kiritimatiellaeota bacterium B1221]